MAQVVEALPGQWEALGSFLKRGYVASRHKNRLSISLITTKNANQIYKEVYLHLLEQSSLKQNRQYRCR
jgi:hypothetical protein